MSTRDTISTTESVEVSLTRIPTPAAHPCRRCGRETLEHVLSRPTDPLARVVPDSRICSSRICGNVQELDS
jgi:hypothetical protein